MQPVKKQALKQRQTTVAHRVACEGVGLHSGSRVVLSIAPAEAGAGIVFQRLDVPAAQSLIPARYDGVVETRLGTTLANAHGVTVSTVEHLMAALWGADIDNALITLDGPEVPIMDGSSEPFLFLLECAGLAKLVAPRQLLKIRRKVEVTLGGSTASVVPNAEGDEGMVLSLGIDFNHPMIRAQAATYDFRDTSFKQALARARTFGFMHEVDAMRKAGLALGGSLDNAVVLSSDGILNEEGLRFSDEFIRHKALDCVGDVFLAGARIDGHFEFHRPGHCINNALLRAVFSDAGNYTLGSDASVLGVAAHESRRVFA